MLRFKSITFNLGKSSKMLDMLIELYITEKNNKTLSSLRIE